MNTQFLHKAELGFLLWADNFLCNRAQAYTTHTSRLYYTPDDRLHESKIAYASPFKGWVYDSGVQGAYIPSSISGSLGTLTEGQSGLQFDYENGRVILNSGVGTNLNLTGTYSFKDFNIYPTNEGLEQIIVENKYYLNSRFDRTQTGIPPYDFVTPAIFVNFSTVSNKPFAFGGLQLSQPTASMVVLAEEPWQLQGVINTFVDAAEKYFPLVEASIDPINESGALRSGYNYTNIAASRPASDLVRIDSVRGSRLTDSIKTNEGLYVGLIDFQLSYARTT